MEQHCLDMMSALRKYSAERIDAQMFTSFVTDEYDQEDLLFFLFVRSMVQVGRCIKEAMFGKTQFNRKPRDCPARR